MKFLFIFICVVITQNQFITSNAASHNRVKRQGINQVMQIIDTITRFSNPSNLFKLLTDAFNGLLNTFNPTSILTRGRRAISVSARHDRELHDYFVKASKDDTHHLIKIHNVGELENDYNWRVVQIPDKGNLPEMPPIPGLSEGSKKSRTSSSKVPKEQAPKN